MIKRTQTIFSQGVDSYGKKTSSSPYELLIIKYTVYWFLFLPVYTKEEIIEVLK